MIPRSGVAMAVATLVLAVPGASADETDRARVEAAQAELALARSPIIEDAPEIRAYVHQVLCRVANDACRGMRIYLVRSPDFGAAISASGAVQIGVGILWRVRTEDELAFVLARLTIAHERDASLKAAAFDARLSDLRMAMVAFASLAAPVLADEFIELGTNVAAWRWRTVEDKIITQRALDRMTASGYRAADAYALSRALAREASARVDTSPSHRSPRDLDRAAPPPKRDATFSVTSPERAGIAILQDLIDSRLMDWLASELSRREQDASLIALERLAGTARFAGRAHYARGELLRRRNGPGDLAQAVEALKQAALMPDAPAETWRTLAAVYIARHEAVEARAAYRTYLLKRPNAVDRLLIEAELDTIPP